MIPFLHLGPVTLPTFGLMMGAAIVAAFFVLRADLRRRGIQADAETLCTIPAVAGIVGAKLYHALESPRELFANPWHELFSQFGFAWFGGLIAGIATLVILARRYRIPLIELCDAASPAAALGYGIGRIGCLLSGDGDYGIPTSLPWGMSFPNGLVPTTPRVHPTPLYELIVAVVIFWILWRMGAKRGRAAGEVFAAYLILTGVARFAVEFIRINPRSFFGLTNAQAASIVSVAAGAVLAWQARAKETKGRPQGRRHNTG